MNRNNKMLTARKIPRILRIAVSAAVIFLFGMAFVLAGTLFGLLPRFQFAPAVLRLCCGFSFGAVVFILTAAWVSILFGRFYCAAFCPFGILQDFIIFFSGSAQKNLHVGNHPLLRYGIAGLVFGLLAGGWTTGFLLLEPYSNAGRIFCAWFSAGGVLILTVIIALAIRRKRLFCTAVCPVGTLLGLLAKNSIFRLSASSDCVKCGICAKSCRADCITIADGRAEFDQERCVRCMDCMALCPKNAIRLSGTRTAPTPVDRSRRKFIMQGAVLAGAAVLGFGIGRSGFLSLMERFCRTAILPPGAGDLARFTSKCTACQLCAAACPEKIIVFAKGGNGPVSLDLSLGACRFDCKRCSEVCPTGAIMPIPLDIKRKTRIAEAHFDPTRCRVFQKEETCGRCAAVCPTHAVSLRKNGTPKPVNTEFCIGCGACQKVCPETPKAITVREIGKQTVLNI